MQTDQITLTGKLSPDLFNTVAQAAAEAVGQDQRSNRAKNVNKPSQLRKFYDELCMWETRVSQQPERFDDLLPFIRMMNAKAVYAQGRRHVDDDFVKLLSHCLGQVTSPETLRTCKTFMEAFMGFYKVYGPKD
ncbi:MAG: type III-A CRISPR-associated protein Csm2 [Candidatus Competibacteraceae bacterium]|nr:type III-A CRISPR-associated protein Csm2 [Candidatus Competibacteraceae bacterium]MCB1806053.1 type III-A CRISPR-associated protein Csm2 [Candidatus Competibacteraceae bacterium]MCB1815214.1 type III-A CRISPR-associated protein Csm2 [Candidatus Competibacteraceae bacterium]